jgi:hypothetical protein
MPSIEFELSDNDVKRIALAVVEELKTTATVTSKPADKPADKPSTKPATKPKADKPKEEAPSDEGEGEVKVPEPAEVLSALRSHQAAHGRPSALKILADYAGGSDKATDVPEDQRAALIEALSKGPSKEEDDDGF